MQGSQDSQLLILSLHRIGYPPPGAKIRGLFTSPRLLKFQLRMLRHLGFRFMTLKDAVERPQGKVAVITFDDGYLDNLDALPILEQFDAPATVFVVTGDVGQRDVVWDEADEDLPADLMSWETLRELKQRGWEIGSHAHDHIHLDRYSREKQNAVVSRSIIEIEANIGETPISFAYPYGGFNRTSKSVLKDLGIKNAVTIQQATFEETIGARDYLELGRISIGGRNIDHYFKSTIRTLRAVGSFRPSLIGRPKLQVSPEASLIQLP